MDNSIDLQNANSLGHLLALTSRLYLNLANSFFITSLRYGLSYATTQLKFSSSSNHLASWFLQHPFLWACSFHIDLECCCKVHYPSPLLCHPFFASLHWLPLLYFIKHKLLVFTSKDFHSLFPLYLSSLIHYWNIYSHLIGSLRQPPSCTFYIFQLFSFCYATPHSWVQLHINICKATLLISFKTLFKILLWCDAYNKI